MKIMFYFLRPFDELAYCEKFSSEFGIAFDHCDDYPDESNIRLARGCEAVSVTPCDLGAKVLDRFHEVGVRYICCRSVGYDHVDLARARELGMRVANVSYSPSGVANYSVMLMMMALRRIMPIMKRAEAQDFTLKGKMGRDISRCTVGIIGTGKIGSTVIRSLSGFGCRILAYDLFKNDAVSGLAEYVPLDRLLEESDIISLHTNVTDATTHIIDGAALEKCRDGVIIVNAARGKLIDTPALIRALESGKVGGAALDVLENENGLYYYNRMGDVIRNDEMAILRSYPNVILSPHTAFYTEDAVESMVRGIFESADAFGRGLPTEHEVFLR